MRPAHRSGAAATGSSVVGEGKDESRVGDRMGGEAAVARIAGEERMFAEVLARASAIGASPVGMAEPGHADAEPKRERDAFARRLDSAHDLMSRHDRQLGVGEFAVDDVQVGAANPAGLDAHANLPRAGLRLWPLLHREPLAGSR